jgi:hypothetical protein
MRIIEKIYAKRKISAGKKLVAMLYVKLRIVINRARGQGYLDKS